MNNEDIDKLVGDIDNVLDPGGYGKMQVERMKFEAELTHSLRQRDRRERIATAVMAGFAAADPRNPSESETWPAEVAVAWADALIALLDKEAPSGKA